MPDSMNAIDVAYQTEISIEYKTTELLTAEVNTEYRQAESLAAMSYRMLADAGLKLVEIKKRIPHGEFEGWCAENLEFSKSKAEKMMKLAEKMGDENSLFSKTETFTDIGISRVWALLAAPEEVATEVMETHDVTDMTVRELKAEIKRLKDEREEMELRSEQAAFEANAESEQKIMDLENNIDHLRHELAQTQGKLSEAVSEEELENMRREYEDQVREAHESEANKELERLQLQEKLGKAKEDLKKAKQKLKDAETEKDEEVQKRLATAAAELEDKHADDIKKAKEEGAADAAASLSQMSEEISRLEAEIEKLETEKEKLSDTTLQEFKILTDQLQDVNIKIEELIDKTHRKNPELADKMRAGLMQLLTEEFRYF